MSTPSVRMPGALEAHRVNGVEFRMVWIAPRSFTMGSLADEAGRWEEEGPQHMVWLTRGYWLGETPVTQRLWEAVTGASPSFFKGHDLPVEQVSWRDCQTFLASLNRMVEGLNARLPTEAEWENACRAGTFLATWRGDNRDETLDPIAWYSANSRDATHPVAGREANPWGLYDMLGNVAEWCEDPMRRYGHNAMIDPRSRARSADRAVRGGSWAESARGVRAARRQAFSATHRSSSIGLRLACDAHRDLVP